MVDRVYAILAGQTQPEHIELGTAPGEAGHTRALPHITISGLAGLLEHLREVPQGHADVYKLAAELKVPLDAFLRVTETAELLGFATLAHGDMTLTPLGETFAEASFGLPASISLPKTLSAPPWNLTSLQKRRHAR